MAELVDAPDLGSGEDSSWGFESPLSQAVLDGRDRPIRIRKEEDWSSRFRRSASGDDELTISVPVEKVEQEWETVVAAYRRARACPGFARGRCRRR